jgi:hypothetical protein
LVSANLVSEYEQSLISSHIGASTLLGPTMYIGLLE